MEPHIRDEDVPPFVPVVRSLLKYPIDSPEFLDAALVAGPAETEFALEIIDHQLAVLQGRQAEIEEELEELEEEFPGIGDAV
jgi:hypothetical protein